MFDGQITAQVVQAVKDSPTTQQVVQQTIQEALKRVDILGAKLGVGAGYLWQIYVAQAKVDGIRDLIMAAALGLLGYVLVVLIQFFWSRASECRDGDDAQLGWYTIAVLSSITLVVDTGFVLGNIYTCVGELINPQYYAIHNLLNDIKNIL